MRQPTEFRTPIYLARPSSLPVPQDLFPNQTHSSCLNGQNPPQQPLAQIWSLKEDQEIHRITASPRRAHASTQAKRIPGTPSAIKERRQTSTKNPRESHQEALARAILSSTVLTGYCRLQSVQYMTPSPPLPPATAAAPPPLTPLLRLVIFTSAVAEWGAIEDALETPPSLVLHLALPLLPPPPPFDLLPLALPLSRPAAAGLAELPTSPSSASCAARMSSALGGGLARQKKHFVSRTKMQGLTRLRGGGGRSFRRV